jgi:hypothetical protein
LGGNVGLTTPYIEPLIEPPPPENNLLEPFMLDQGDTMYVDGQRVSCSMDGMTVGCGMAMRALENGSAIPAALARYQNQPGFKFESHGLGIYTTQYVDSYSVGGKSFAPTPYGFARAWGWAEETHSSTIFRNIVVDTWSFSSSMVSIEHRTQTNDVKNGDLIPPVGKTPSKEEQKKIDETKTTIKKILAANGPCATFFGKDALNALTSLTFQVAGFKNQGPQGPNVVNGSTGIYMNLKAIDATATKNGYVSVSSAIINQTGGFFATTYLSEGKSYNTPLFGKNDTFNGYAANTLQSRVLQVLHELGHIILKDGTHLLGIDGNGIMGKNKPLSQENTDEVLKNCKAEIDALK